MRIDLFLKLSGLLKTRSLAERACDAGAVTIDGRTAKCASKVVPGSVVELVKPDGERAVFRVLGIPVSKSVSKADRASLYQLIAGGSQC